MDQDVRMRAQIIRRVRRSHTTRVHIQEIIAIGRLDIENEVVLGTRTVSVAVKARHVPAMMVPGQKTESVTGEKRHDETDEFHSETGKIIRMMSVTRKVRRDEVIIAHNRQTESDTCGLHLIPLSE